MPREGHGSRNSVSGLTTQNTSSCPARGMGVEMSVTVLCMMRLVKVMPREGHGSRNEKDKYIKKVYNVMPREGHGSRNEEMGSVYAAERSHAPRGAWE